MSSWITITNVTKGEILADKGELANSALLRMIGLLGRDTLPLGQALIIQPCNSIHTFFMKFPIDVVFVNRQNCIIKIIEAMRPFRMSGIYPKARYVIEFPMGLLNKTQTQIGDTLKWHPPSS